MTILCVFTSYPRTRPALNLYPLCVCLLPPRFDAPDFVRVLGNRSILLAQGGRHDGRDLPEGIRD